MNKKIIIILVLGYVTVTGLLLYLFFQGDISFKWHHYFSWGTFIFLYFLSPFFDMALIGMFAVFLINCFFELIVMNNV